MYQVKLSPTARRQLGKLDRPMGVRVAKALMRLGTLDDPRGPCKAPSGPLAGLWRLRVGDYRVILDIRDGQLVVVALRIGHRRDIYR